MKIKEIFKQKFNITLVDIAIFSIVIIIYLTALLSFFPGILTSDNVDQINQAMNNLYTSGHPIIHSFIIGNLTKLGGIWVPALFQIIVFALIWTYLCKTLRKYNDRTINKVIQIILTILICILPLNFLYAITLWKDILYSYAILLMLILVYIGIKEKYKYTNIQIILISLSSVGIMKFRHNGLPIGLFMFGILFLLNFIHNKNKKSLIKMIISFLLIFGLVAIIESVVNKVPPTPGGSVLNSTKVYCFGALLNEDIQLEEDEKEFLNTILDLKEWKENFNNFDGTPILFSPNINHKVLRNEDNIKRFNEIFYKYANQNKKTVLKHFLNINSIWWSIEEKGGMHSVVLSNDWVSEMCNGAYDNKPILESGNKALIDYTNFTLGNKTIYELIYRPAVSLYLSLGISIYIIVKGWKKGEKAYILLLFPMGLNIGTYLILISAQDHRYFYPSHITAYFLLMLFVNVFTENKHNFFKRKNKIENEIIEKR